MKRLLILLLLVSFRSVLTQTNNSNEALKYSPLTENLLAFLQGISGKKVLFGHQDDLAYGIGWEYVDGNSDVKKVTGSYPAVFGWGKKENSDEDFKALWQLTLDCLRI